VALIVLPDPVPPGFRQNDRVAAISIPLLQHAAYLADRHVLWAYDAVQRTAALEVQSLA
jgi:hypothetical protein